MTIGQSPVPFGNAHLSNMLLDALPSMGPNNTIVSTVIEGGGKRTFAMANGEFRAAVAIVSLGGVAPSAALRIAAIYRSYLTIPGTSTADYDPTGGQWPFGQGWAASFAEGLLYGATAGQAVTFVDSLGTAWSFTNPSEEVVQSGPQAGSWWVYPAKNGTRIVAWVHDSTVTWFREFPDRTRIEYEPIPGAGSGAVGYRIKRIFRGDELGSVVWTINYTYADVDTGEGTVIRLTQITDTRGFTVTFAWTEATTGNWRIDTVTLSNSNVSGSTSYLVDLVYDSSARLCEVRYPARSILYDNAGAGDLDSLDTYYARGLGFEYDGSSRVSAVKRLLRTNASSWSSYTSETWLTNTYQSSGGKAWQLLSQVVGTGGGARTHSYATTWDQTGTILNKVTWTDPLGVVHEIEPTMAGGTSPARWHVDKYTRIPRSGDPSGLGTKIWDFDWDSCGCGRLTKVKLPTGRSIEYVYDGEGRGLPTTINLISDNPTSDPKTRTWTLTYHTWGAAAATGETFFRASRPTSLTTESGSVWSISYVFNSSTKAMHTDLTVDSGSGGLSLDYDIDEDKYQRVTLVEEPSHLIGGTSGTWARVKTGWGYQDTITANGYGLVSQIAHYRAQGTAYEDFAYDLLGHVTQHADELDKVTNFSVDYAGQVTQVSLPDVTSGKTGSPIQGITATFQYGQFGEVVKSELEAIDPDGSGYGNAVVEGQAGANFFGEIVARRIESQKLSTSGSTWLTTTYTYDVLGRLTSVLRPGSRRTDYLLTDYDMVQEIRERDVTTNNDPSTWPKTTIFYNSEGKPTQQTDRNGIQTTYTYETSPSHLRLKEVSVASGELKIEIVWPSLGSVQLPISLTYFAEGTLVAQRDFTRDTIGRMLTSTLTDKVTNKAHTDTYSWTGTSYVRSVTDSNGRAVSYAWDSGGLLEWLEDSLSSSDKNRSEVVRDAKTRVTQILRKVKQEAASGGSYSNVTYKDVLVYDEWDRVRQVDRFGKTSSKITDRKYGFDTLGNLTWFQDSEGRVRKEHFDSVGRTWKSEIVPQSGSGDATIELEQDFQDSPGSYGTDGFGGTLNATTLSLVVTRKDGRDKETRYLYDMLGRLVERRVPGYDGTAQAFRWSYKYAGGGPLEKWKDGNGHTVHIDRDDNLLRGTKRRVVPNTSAVPLSLMTGFEEWAYDDDGRKVTRRTRSGAWATGDPDWLVDELRSYDSLGRLHSEAFGFGEGSGSGHQSKTTKTVGYAYAHGSSGDDTGFRRGMSLPSGWDFEFDPDGAGKQKEMRLKGPGDSSFFQAAIWRYEGARAHARDFRTGSSASFYRTTTQVDDLGYLKQLTAVFNPSSPTTVFDQVQKNDKEGNVLWRKFDKIQGGQYTASTGDWYGLDGHARLKEARLGIDFDGSGNPLVGSSDPYDKKIQYALDVAQNRTSVTENGTPASYTVDDDSNRYDATPYGTLTYDGNGNLIWDGYRLYVYDYLDRLCEVWDYIEGTEGMSGGDGYKSSSWSKLPLALTRAEASAIVARLQKHLSTTTATRYKGLSEIDQLVKTEKIDAKNAAQQSVTATFVLRALYGYDSFNRRIFRVTEGDGVRWHTWDGWQLSEEWVETEGPTFTARKVFFDGVGIDEHLGYATYDGSTWTRYTMVQDCLGNVMQVLNDTGSAQEVYEYDAYGRRTIYQWQSSQWQVASATAVGNAYGFTGRQHDPETGLAYLRNRYLDPLIGRFLTTDTIGDWADGENWGNGYGYGGNAASALTDPLGLLAGSLGASPPRDATKRGSPISGGGKGSDAFGGGSGDGGGGPTDAGPVFQDTRAGPLDGDDGGTRAGLICSNTWDSGRGWKGVTKFDAIPSPADKVGNWITAGGQNWWVQVEVTSVGVDAAGNPSIDVRVDSVMSQSDIDTQQAIRDALIALDTAVSVAELGFGGAGQALRHLGVAALHAVRLKILISMQQRLVRMAAEKLLLCTGVITKKRGLINVQKSGGMAKAKAEFEEFLKALGMTDTRQQAGGIVSAKLPGGGSASVRPTSSGGFPTIQINQPGGPVIKIRY